MPQQLVIQPLGLVTQPGKLVSLPPGSMSVADNVYIRSPYKLERARPWAIAASDSPIGLNRPAWSLPSGSNPWSLVIYETGSNVWSRAWHSPAFPGSAYTGTTLLNEDGANFFPRSDGSVWVVEANTFQYVNMDCGVACFERSANPPSATDNLSSAGLRPPLGFFFVGPNPQSIIGGAIENGYSVAYTAIIRRKHANGSESVSAPCSSYWSYYSYPPEYPSANANGQIAIDGDFCRAGDFLEIYRTQSQKWTLDDAYTSVGSDYYRVCSIQLTASHVSAWYVDFVDSSPDDALGDALYTNDGFQGTEAQAYQPPAAACMAQFKGHTFYGNLKQPASISLRPCKGWVHVGYDSVTPLPQAAFGQRLASVNQTNGNATVTPTNTDILNKLVVGMRVYGTGYPGGSPGGSRITAVGGSNFTVSPAPTSTLSNNFVTIMDVMELNGTEYVGGSPTELATNVAYYFPGSDLRVYGIDVFTPPTNSDTANYTAWQSVGLVTIRNEKMVGARSAMPSFTIRATHGALFDPPLPKIESSEAAMTVAPTEQTDGYAWSEQHQPGRVPLSNYERLGGGATIIAWAPTKDAMLIFTNKGVKRLSGNGGSAGDGYDWRVDPIDETLILTGPRAWCVLRDVVYARTTRGVVAITSEGTVTPLTEGVIGDLLPGRLVAPGTAYTKATAACVWMAADEANGEVLLHDYISDTTGVYRYNIVTKTWVVDRPTTAAAALHHGVYYPYDAMVGVYYVPDVGTNRFFSPQAAPGTWPASQMAFQPICGENPFEQKHWQAIDPLFVSAGAISALAVNINGTAWYTNLALNAEGTMNARRRSITVPRDAPAIAPSITVGLTIAASSIPFEMIGLSVQFETISYHRIQR